MSDWFLTNESTIRLGSFLTVFIIMAVWEFLLPSRTLLINKLIRWLNHGALILISNITIKGLSPFVLTGLALYASEHQIGLLSQVNIPLWLSVVLSLLLMDGLIYWQHRLMHVVPLLWRLHRLHHSDLDYDVTTAIRFHPIEMLLSFFIKAGAVLVLGVPVIAVILFEVLLSALALFNHANINLPKTIEKIMRVLVVTPDVHRIHHSVIREETNSNYGFNLIIWDKMFGSYITEAKHGDQKIILGLDEFKNKQQATRLYHLLIQPFKNIG